MFANKKLEKIAAGYVALQAVIWVKAAAFFSIFGHGKVFRFTRDLFTQDAIFFDYWFHEAMHVSIGALALAFGFMLEELEWKKFTGFVGVAVVLHNIGYWLTASHPGIEFSAIDYGKDAILLAVFVLAGYAIGKIAKRRASAQAAI